jgi:diguanylate cyclase (GGDEF)-like protein/PAS domain S-box-containing protein
MSKSLQTSPHNISVDSSWLNLILDSADFTIISTDAKGIIRSANQGALERLGYNPVDLIGIHTPALIHDKDEVAARAKVLSEELGKEVVPGFDVFKAKACLGITDENEWSYIRKDGSRFPVILSVTALKDDDGHIEGYLCIGRDISLRRAMERKIELQKDALEQANAELTEANQRLNEMIQTDPLTDLLNRRGFHKCFDQEVQRLKRQQAPLSMLLMDLDYFKQYNDQYGHLEGDHLLENLSAVLKTHIRVIDYVARFGGEEFIFLLPQTDEVTSIQIAERYRKLVEEMSEVKRPITASFGVSTILEVNDNESIAIQFDRMLEQADQAMYKSKENGRNKVTHFSSIK